MTRPLDNNPYAPQADSAWDLKAAMLAIAWEVSQLNQTLDRLFDVTDLGLSKNVDVLEGIDDNLNRVVQTHGSPLDDGFAVQIRHVT